MRDQSYAENLGWNPTSRAVLFGIDDSDRCHDSDIGAKLALSCGIASSAKVMFPCEEYRYSPLLSKENPQGEIGIHLTLPSTWEDCAWGPVSPVIFNSSIVRDRKPCFLTTKKFDSQALSQDVKNATAAQIELGIKDRLHPSHLDSHVLSLFERLDLLAGYTHLSIQYHTPSLIPWNHISLFLKDLVRFAEPTLTRDCFVNHQIKLARALGNTGLPVVADFQFGSYDCPRNRDLEFQKINIQYFSNLIETLSLGTTVILIHCAEVIAMKQGNKQAALTRRGDLVAMTSPLMIEILSENKITISHWREFNQRRRSSGNQ